jgi:hypothetical protein
MIRSALDRIRALTCPTSIRPPEPPPEPPEPPARMPKPARASGSQRRPGIASDIIVAIERGASSLDEIVAAIPVPAHRKAVVRQLSDLVKRGAVQRVSLGVYARAG